MHYEVRSLRNSNLPDSPDNARFAGGTKLEAEMSKYHDDPLTPDPELKYIFQDGREAVYYSDTHTLVTDPIYMGTYNYVNPAVPSMNPAAWPGIALRAVGHFTLDMLPYYIGGNQRGAY
jgi:hypothetical protein